MIFLDHRLFEVEGSYRTKTRELEDNVTQLRQETISITQAFKVWKRRHLAR